MYREGWWGVWGEEGGKKIHFRGYGRDSADDGKHLRCREFRLYREGWWGVRGEEGGKKIVWDRLGSDDGKHLRCREF